MGTILPFISDNSFSPEDIEALDIAYTNACAAVGANDDAKLKESIAYKILTFALGGERDSTKLYLRFMQTCAQQMHQSGQRRTG